ncbi:hypothetical protein SAMN06264364_11995 [Quadrisphaera granulorum]|uniref:Uncharacterized protein n=1 Tax=Quadrisphaera granulorum TaxID=317664 RepID=A0A316A6J5_9ACTN|nr:hypothetical protein [Quadrisphaera granulorum]PWJ52600.1 hypothetical protein BXY45_11995 [Quadrisphaera granulorum]SZE97650.1 hypothetical protein SAMN06264364_11995 [Quadrisphaera granulorum]
MSHTVSLPPTRPADGAQWRAAWTHALDALELDVNDVENLLDALHSAADATAQTEATEAVAQRARLFHQLDGSLGPMPMELAHRARVLLARQLDAGAYLSRAMVANRRHARAAEEMQVRPHAGIPLYVDAEA